MFHYREIHETWFYFTSSVCVKVEISGKVIHKLCNALASNILYNCAKLCKIIISKGYEKQTKVHKNKSTVLESHVHAPTTQI